MSVTYKTILDLEQKSEISNADLLMIGNEGTGELKQITWQDAIKNVSVDLSDCATKEEVNQLSEEIADLDSTELREYVEEQMGEVVLEENMTDAFDFFVGFLNKNGNPVSLNYGGVTDFIPVEIGDVFYWSGASDVNGSCGVCEYDQNKNFIKGDALATESYKITRNVKYTVTEGAFVRFSTMTESKKTKFID